MRFGRIAVMGNQESEKDTPIVQQEHLGTNPNSIGELLSVGRDLPTSPDRVYRSVSGRAAVDDLNDSGVVRNKQSAGLVSNSRWGERVFWSRGASDKYHSISKNTYVIEAPLSVAEKRIVTKEDVTAIYTKDEAGKVVNILQPQSLPKALPSDEKIHDAEKLREIRKNLGLEE